MMTLTITANSSERSSAVTADGVFIVHFLKSSSKLAIFHFNKDRRLNWKKVLINILICNNNALHLLSLIKLEVKKQCRKIHYTFKRSYFKESQRHIFIFTDFSCYNYAQ